MVSSYHMETKLLYTQSHQLATQLLRGFAPMRPLRHHHEHIYITIGFHFISRCRAE
jgi:hypothetical protein